MQQIDNAPVITWTGPNGIQSGETITLEPGAHATLHITVKAEGTNLRTLSLSGAYQSGSLNLQKAPSANMGITWYVSFYPAGTYKFTATVTDGSGKRTSESVTFVKG